MLAPAEVDSKVGSAGDRARELAVLYEAEDEVDETEEDRSPIGDLEGLRYGSFGGGGNDIVCKVSETKNEGICGTGAEARVR